MAAAHTLPGGELPVPIRFPRELGMVLTWLVYPLVPVVLEDVYYQTCNYDVSGRMGPDPRAWGWLLWVILLGPLLGYGFLAGATVDLPDDPGTTPRRWRRLLARRAMWVSVGPWAGFLFRVAVYFGYAFLVSYVPALQRADLRALLSPWWRGTTTEQLLRLVAGAVVVGILSYGWIWPAWSALRRAARLGRWPRALYRGLAVALGFVGSLFGSFWAVTAYWRSYFFDARWAPLLAAALGLACVSGCGTPITYGELRRRDLFHAMLVAWVLGLALMWRWWSRRRPSPPA